MAGDLSRRFHFQDISLKARSANMASRRQIADAIAAVARTLGRVPTLVEFLPRGRISRHEILQQFATWNDAVEAAELEPRPRKTARRRKQLRGTHERIAYGNPINLHSLRHEPLNEQGVVLLFGILARDLGFVVEAIQTSFPDCEAKRQISPNRWERLRIEFEFESRNFEAHGHPVDGCDVIVCWRHNWPECPARLEVIELSSVVTKAL